MTDKQIEHLPFFKQCPYCKSERIEATNENPDFVIGEKGRHDSFSDEMICFECSSNWTITYEAKRIDGDLL